jgi:hypothetical protein
MHTLGADSSQAHQTERTWCLSLRRLTDRHRAALEQIEEAALDLGELRIHAEIRSAGADF